MFETIAERLSEIERQENIRIIHAAESGSRAWGFESPDSDYDVRFIYVRPMDYYLKLEKTRDVIELQVDPLLDINGWDLQKALRLLHKSNPTLFEWNNSQIIYKTANEWGAIQKEINDYFIAKAGLHHYHSTATSNYREYLKGETVQLKKYFYVVRPLLACKWILQKNSPPPILFSELVDAVLEEEMKPVIAALLEQKMSMPEMGKGKRIDKLNKYIDNNIATLKTKIEELPGKTTSDWERLNELFLSIVK